MTVTASWKHVAALVGEVDEGVFDNGVGVGVSTAFISPPRRSGSATFGPHQIAIGVSEFVIATYKSPGGGTAGTATSNTVTCG